MHLRAARAHTLSARTRTHSLRAKASALPPCAALTANHHTVAHRHTHRLPCVFRCFGERLAKQALGYVHT